MNKLNRRTFLLTTGIAAIAAPVAANADSDVIENQINQITEALDRFDELSAKSQQKIIADFDGIASRFYPNGETSEFSENLKQVFVNRAKPIN